MHNIFVSKLSVSWSILDFVAVLFFIGGWIGYTFFADHQGHCRPSLLAAMSQFRKQWMMQSVLRDNRMVDSSIIGNLLHGSTFFASTTLLILGGLIALLGTIEKATTVIAEIPFAVATSERLWEIKIILLVAIFVYAFFKFTWSVRQFNFVAVLIGSFPITIKPEDNVEHWVNRASTIASIASENNNQGLRAYYFGLAALSWFFHPTLLIASTVGVVYVLYWREFRSRTLQALVSHTHFPTSAS